MKPVRGPRRSRVYLVGDGSNPRIRRALDELRPWLEERARVTGTWDDPKQPFKPGRSDFVLILGGDGAILRAAIRMAGRKVPCIGIRLGNFGFLAELEPSTCHADLERVLAGEGKVHDRMLLDCEVRRGTERVVKERAMNDVVVLARTPAQMLSLALDVDGEPVATYRGDGLLVSTPTGSTAHSLAAGGPVMEPGTQSILVTPLSPHTLASRPLVLRGDRRLKVKVRPRYRRTAQLVLDGQRSVALRAGDEVRVRRSTKTVRLLSVVERSFFQTLRAKFRWAGSASDEPE